MEPQKQSWVHLNVSVVLRRRSTFLNVAGSMHYLGTCEKVKHVKCQVRGAKNVNRFSPQISNSEAGCRLRRL